MLLAETWWDNAVAWTTQTQFLDIRLWRWLGLLLSLFASLVVGKVVSFTFAKQAERLEGKGRLRAVSMIFLGLSKPSGMMIFALGLYFGGLILFGGETTGPRGSGRHLYFGVCKTIGAIAVTWFVFRLVDVVEHYLRHLTGRTRSALDDQIVPLVRKTLRIFVVIVGLIFIAQNIFQWDVSSLLAGLGLGGLAFALAAKEMVANLFGSVTIFADRAFRVGDRIKVADTVGVVEEVGFRATRLRTLDGCLVNMPNAKMTSEPVENFSRRPSFKRVLNVTVTYDTPPARLQRGLDILREMLDARKANFPPDTPPRVYFSDFNADSLNLQVIYWYVPATDWWAYMQFTHDFNMELLQRFNDEGIEFAFPTQTLYLKKGDAPAEPPADGRA